MQAITLENKRGFTLIELVIVIVLVGILAATVLPKFANLTTKAYAASNQGVAGGLAAAVSIAHAAWIAGGAPATASTVTLDGVVVNINGTGWPAGSASAVGPTATADCLTAATGILNNPPQVLAACAATTGTCYQAVWTTPQTCTYTLYFGGTAVSGPAHTITYNGNTGAVGST